ncbi:MAG: UbiA family prenyltransferase [Chloroflexota bacterium]
MTRSRLPAVVRLVHPFPVATVTIMSLFLLVITSTGGLSQARLLQALLAVVMSQIAIGSLNDYLDRLSDQVGQAHKPIPAGEINPPLALAIALGALVAFVVVAFWSGLATLIVLGLGTAFGLAYDLWLKPTPLSVLGYLGGFLCLLAWVWILSGRDWMWLPALFPGAALLIIAAHIAQSMADIEADVSLGQRGLAVLLGPHRSLRAVTSLSLLAAVAGLALCLGSRSLPSTVILAAGVVLVLAAGRLSRGRELTRDLRMQIFHVTAPGMALIGLGSLLALIHIS